MAAVTEVTYAMAEEKLGVLPSLYPRPSCSKIRALYTHLRRALAGFASFQSADYGYMGMVDKPEVYALTGAAPWVNVPNPGVHRVADGTMSATQQRDAEVIYTAQLKVWTSENNVRSAVNAGLNKAVPEKYRRISDTAMGGREYRPTDEPWQIIDHLTRRYGDKSPEEVEWLDTEWRKDWSPVDPIEDLIHRLEEFFIFATYMGPVYTNEQLIERAHIKKTGLFQVAVVEWEGYAADNKTRPEWKIGRAHV